MRKVRSRWVALVAAAIGIAGGAIAFGVVPASSAGQNGNPVTVTNTPLPVSGTVGVSGTVQTGATTQVIKTADVFANAGQGLDLLGGAVDTTAYKEVTAYITVSVALGTQNCVFYTVFNGDLFPIISQTLSTNLLVETLDPAPPNLQIVCSNATNGLAQYSYMVVGRSN